jgi:hypothetical protein
MEEELKIISKLIQEQNIINTYYKDSGCVKRDLSNNIIIPNKQ